MDTKQKIIISVLMLGTLMGSLDSTIVILAFPTISNSLHATFITTLWMILIYLLVVAVCTTQLGRIGDIWGRGRMFNAGFGVFTLGSLFCGLSPGIYWLIASRGIQAVGGALMQANSGAIIADMFPPNVRGTAFGYLSLGWTSGAMLGIVLGGIITTYVGWEYIFFINIPIGIAATVLGFRYVTDNPRVNATLDIPGMVLLGTALTFISFSGVDFATEGTDCPEHGHVMSRRGLHCALRALRTPDKTTHHRFLRTGKPDSQIFDDGCILPQSRLPVGGVSYHDVPSGHPRLIAS